jgi:hypothetical protein
MFKRPANGGKARAPGSITGALGSSRAAVGCIAERYERRLMSNV